MITKNALIETDKTESFLPIPIFYVEFSDDFANFDALHEIVKYARIVKTLLRK